MPKSGEAPRGEGARVMLKKGFWSVAPFFIRQPPLPAHLCSACRKSVAASASIIFLHNFLVSCAATAAKISPISSHLYPASSVLFSVALHISAAAHKFCSVCPSAKGSGEGWAFVKNHCCYSNFMEIPTLFLAFSFQRTDLRLRKICLSYASLRLILQKTKKNGTENEGVAGKKLLLGLSLLLQRGRESPLRVARSCPAVGGKWCEAGA